MASLPGVRTRYRDAWVFIDRDRDADDNAEHLYRWVRREHPEINAWFLLKPGTPDWQRLAEEGFRLMPPGLSRKLLLLNSSHVISSHPEHSMGGFDHRLYGDAMRWRFTYLTHGVGQNDLSPYYVDGNFDCFLTPSPAEFSSMVSDDTPYEFTAREVRLCNFPRHDRLLQLARSVPSEDIDEILVMPTWRGRLIDDDLGFAERLRLMESSEYVRTWSALLQDPVLRDLARAHGKKVVFVPHSNLIPYLQAFDIPGHVQVAVKGESVQTHLARCFAFVTDYTSVAFDVALLRRGVFYLQFDRDRFYRGEHNWRPGYFDYQRDGFGPVATSHPELVRNLEAFVGQGGRPAGDYLARMERAMPDRSTGACGHVYDAIESLRRRSFELERAHLHPATAGEATSLAV